MKISLDSAPDKLESSVTIDAGNGLVLTFTRDNMSGCPPIKVDLCGVGFRMTAEQFISTLRLLETLTKP